jgi:hypothetical protein
VAHVGKVHVGAGEGDGEVEGGEPALASAGAALRVPPLPPLAFPSQLSKIETARQIAALGAKQHCAL